MADVVIYTKGYCPFCARAKALLGARGVAFTEHEVTHDRDRFAEMVDRSGRRTVPQVFIDGAPVGGSDDLAALEASGGLDRLLHRAPA
ncbi:MAG: glutaredoxin 3 [Pseudomonadota bacterium]